MRNNDNKRMHDMYLRDCFMAWFDVVLLWSVVIFVLIAILSIVVDPNIRLVLYISSAMLVLFNTASVYAMTKHFKEDKDYIYGLDLKHLDLNRAAKMNARRLS